jgi:hypothetical protein
VFHFAEPEHSALLERQLLDPERTWSAPLAVYVQYVQYVQVIVCDDRAAAARVSDLYAILLQNLFFFRPTDGN